ncbi:MAG: VOC family protein [Candidatus Tectomicrobia bacterium]|uniref:VOC family protein n=1 Tax=Tectimicrobiota bacterium TaxID=2528274 RepID=A0A933LR50_UNCTE|nr:VOC family protein [Candidatus Tectomicrobia bacterium]
MATKVKPIPDGYHTITPVLAVHDGVKAIDFYRRAFGAEELFRMEDPPGKIMHAELQIGDSRLMLSDEMPGCTSRSPQSLGGTPVNLFLYVEDVDQAFNRAVAAGAKVEMPVTDMFWGDRFGSVKDPFGHSWSFATHKEDVPTEELAKRAKAAMGK